MKRAYPTIKFVPPRPTGKPAAGSGQERRFTPPLREAASVSPVIAKRKRPTTQSWKGPRRRLDPPSPSKAQSTASTTNTDAGRRTVEEAGVGVQTPWTQKSNNCHRTSRPVKSHRCSSSAGSPDTPSIRRYMSRKPLVMAAETPTRSRNHPSSSRQPMSERRQLERMGGLRIPDTPIRHKSEPRRDLKISEDRRAKRREGKCEVSDDGGDHSTSCSSSLSSPVVELCLKEQEQEAEAGVGREGTTAVVPLARPQGPSSSGDSEAGSDSPDLLRKYTMETNVKLQKPTQGVPHDRASSDNAGGPVMGVLHDKEPGSEGSDGGSESPDLLRRYSLVDTTSVLNGPKQAAAAGGRDTGQQATSAPPEPPPQETNQSYSCGVEMKPERRGAQDSASSAAERLVHLATPSRLGDSIFSIMAERETRDAAAEGSALSDKTGLKGSTGTWPKHKPPLDKGFDHGAEGSAGKDEESETSAMAPSSMLLTTESTTLGAGSSQDTARDEGFSARSPKSPTKSAAGGNVDRSGDARCSHGCLGLLKVDKVGTTAGRIRCCAEGITPGVDRKPRPAKTRPAPGSAAMDSRLTIGATYYGTTANIQASAPKGIGLGSTRMPNPYDLAPRKATSRLPEDVLNPCNVVGSSSRAPAPPGSTSARVPNPYDTVQVSASRGGGSAAVPNPYDTKPSRSRFSVPPVRGSAGLSTPQDDTGTTSSVPPQPCAPVSVPNPYDTMGTSSRLLAAPVGRATAVVPNPYDKAGTVSRGPAAAVPAKQDAKASPTISTRSSCDTPRAQIDSVRRQQEASGSSTMNTRPSVDTSRARMDSVPRQQGASGSSSDGSCKTPPEVRFEVAHQQLYKNPRSGTTGRGGRGRRRGTGRGRGVARGAKRGSTAPRPAQDALVGVWRSIPARKKGERGTQFYISLSGQKLSGREATRAASEDQKRVKEGLGPVTKDRSAIMSRIGQGKEPPSCKEAYGGEKYLHEDALKLGTYKIPEQLVESYAKRGIRGLFRWQAHCLRVDDGKPLGGGNLVYSAPTSGGKTLVAELLLLRALLKHSGTMALLVVPYVALALEKRDYLRDVWSPLQLNIQAYHGGEGGDGSDMEGVNVAICTMEKANSIVNRLAEEKRLAALSAVVVDEMHLIGDRARGFLLELMLTKQRLLCPNNVQASKCDLICLSATLPNIECLAKWLDASLYRTAYRPVELRHFVCQGRAVYRPTRIRGTGGGVAGGDDEGALEKASGDIKRVGGTSPRADPDGVVDLVKDALARDMSVLVFCSTKKWCQQTATLLAKEVLSDRNRAAVRAAAVATAAAGKSSCVNGDGSRIDGGGKGKAAGLTGFVPAKSMVLAATAAAAGAAVESTKSPHPRARDGTAGEQGTGATATTTLQQGSKATERRRGASSPTTADDVREKLRQTPVGLDADLSYLVGAGIAFHHSGLVVEERSILEEAFRQGSIRVLVATSTLAAGVNLPAHRVIIRSPSVGIGLLDSTRYHQMAGRSGRAGVSRGEEGGKAVQGVDTARGESFLILPKNVKFTLSDASKLISAPLPKLESALRDAKGGGLERALLE
ncbi:unnamed protein product, partial [Ectocarpus sp. 12 AP-2014]